MVTQNSINTENPVVQLKSSSTGSLVTCSTTMPLDDTIPQNTEGTEVLTLSITPRSTTNKLEIFFSSLISNLGDTGVSIALFQDTTDNALAANDIYTTQFQTGSLVHVMPAGTTSSTTFKIRVGPVTGTCYVNGYSGSRWYDGVSSTTLTITEYLA